MTTPQNNIIVGIKIEGRIRLRSKLLGTCFVVSIQKLHWENRGLKGLLELLQTSGSTHFQEDVKNEEHEERDVVVVARHVEVFFEALNARIADVDPER